MGVYEHLGVPTGYHVAQSADKALKDINLKLQMTSDSLLAPWQKLDAINTILPRISFHLKNGVVQKGPLNLTETSNVLERNASTYPKGPVSNLSVPELPKGRPKPPTNQCSDRHQPASPWTGAAPFCTLGETINGLPGKCSEETNQTTARAARLSQLSTR